MIRAVRAPRTVLPQCPGHADAKHAFVVRIVADAPFAVKKHVIRGSKGCLFAKVERGDMTVCAVVYQGSRRPPMLPALGQRDSKCEGRRRSRIHNVAATAQYVAPGLPRLGSGY